MFDSEYYDELWARVDAFISRVNPCKVSEGTCFRGRCGGDNFCCAGCSHLCDTGCGANRPLSCRTWLCAYAYDNLSRVHQREHDRLLSDVFDRSPFFAPRMSKDELEAGINSRAREVA